MSSRRKGKRIELAAAKMLSKLLHPLSFRRTAQVSSLGGMPDVELDPSCAPPGAGAKLWIEVKARKARLYPCELHGILRKARERASSECQLYVLLYKIDRSDWHAGIARKDDFRFTKVNLHQLAIAIREVLQCCPQSSS